MIDVRSIGTMAHDDRLGPERKTPIWQRRRRGISRWCRSGGLPAASQHCENDGLADTLALQRHELFRLDGEDGVVAFDERQYHLVGNARVRQRDDFLN